MKKFTTNSTLSEILDKQGGESMLHKHGVPCVTCPMAKLEIDKLKIGEVCKMYGLELEKILKDLNK